MSQPVPQQGNPQPSSEQFKPTFNQEELRVLRECNRESFYFRSLPFATAFSTATFVAMKRGILRVSQRFGYTPKILGAVFVGYFVGKLSYQNACAEKLMQLPNSPIGEALRKRKGRMGFQETLGMEPGFSVAFPSSEMGSAGAEQPIFDDHRPDVRDHNEGLLDYERGVTESLTPYTEAASSIPQQHTTYQELRRQNREEYVNKMAEKYRRPSTDPGESGGPAHIVEDPQPTQSTYKPPPPPAVRTNVRKNQYGDEIYE